MMLAYLALLVALSLPGYLDALHGLYAFDQPELFQKKSNCKPIPANLFLCHDIEYTNMRLPNLLGHETMDEVLQQASSWTPLVQKQCHPDTKKFLCSLFAPVCLDDLDEPIQPCRSLCESVKSGCAPVMAAFGFPWPDMLDCNRFPLDNDLCIPPAGADALVPVTKEGKIVFLFCFLNKKIKCVHTLYFYCYVDLFAQFQECVMPAKKSPRMTMKLWTACAKMTLVRLYFACFKHLN